MPKKPLRFVLEFTGWQSCRIDDDGAVRRPINAEEAARAIAEDLQARAFSAGNSFFKVTVKKLD